MRHFFLRGSQATPSSPAAPDPDAIEQEVKENIPPKPSTPDVPSSVDTDDIEEKVDEARADADEAVAQSQETLQKTLPRISNPKDVRERLKEGELVNVREENGIATLTIRMDDGSTKTLYVDRQLGHGDLIDELTDSLKSFMDRHTGGPVEAGDAYDDGPWDYDEDFARRASENNPGAAALTTAAGLATGDTKLAKVGGKNLGTHLALGALGPGAKKTGDALGKTARGGKTTGFFSKVVDGVSDVFNRLRGKKGAAGPTMSQVATATTKKLQKKFKHAADFGVTGNPNKENLAKFRQAIQDHLNSPGTKQINGSYRGDPAIINVDPNTRLAVIRKPNGEFVSGWKLSPDQLTHVLASGKLGGG